MLNRRLLLSVLLFVGGCASLEPGDQVCVVSGYMQGYQATLVDKADDGCYVSISEMPYLLKKKCDELQKGVCL